MDASEYKEYIFEFSFKRLSDEFEVRRFHSKFLYSHLSAEEINDLLEDKTTYKDAFLFPIRQRWEW